MPKLLLLSSSCAITALVLCFSGCAKTPSVAQTQAEEQAVLEQSTFYPGDLAPEVQEQKLVASVTSESTGESGVIAPPGSGGASEGGSISNPGTSTGGSTGTSGGSSGSGSTGSTGGSTGSIPNPNAGGGTTAGNPATGGSTSTPGTTTPGTTGGTSGESGTIAGGGSTSGGTDGGSLPNPNSGGGSTDGGTVAGNPSSGGTAPGGGNGTGGGSTTPGTSDGGTVAGNPPASGPTNPGSTTDGGTVAGNPGGSTGGTDGGTIPGGSTGGNGTDGGTVAGNPPAGGTTPPGTTPGGSTGGGTTTPPTDNGGGTTPGGPIAGGGGTPGTTPGGTDGGTIPGGSPPPNGGETGSIPCSDPAKCKELEIKITRLCSEMRSKKPYPTFIFFEEAQRPLITLETIGNTANACVVHNRKPPQYASMGIGGNYSPHPLESHLVNLLLNKIDMKGVSLTEQKYTTRVQIAVAKIQEQFASTWKKMTVKVRACEDSNNNGLCSDENEVNTLSFASASFSLSNVPRSVTLEVWNGRTLTLKKNPQVCEKQYSPIVLDLGGNGIRLQGPEEGVKFDLDDAGEAVYTGWVNGSDDALLARDLDGNGRIDSGAELFGSATRLASGQRAANGFEALKDLDSDNDGKITPRDQSWSELVLWLDRNGNGRTDRGELVSMSRGGIQSMNLDYIEMMEVDPYGNQTRQRSTFRRNVDGKSIARLMIDVWFNTLVSE